MREELAKVRVRVSAYDEVKPVSLEKAIMQREKQLDRDCWYHKTDYDNTIPQKERNCINTWDSSAVWSQQKDKLKRETNHQEECSSCKNWWRWIKDNVPAFEATITTRYWYRYLQWKSDGLQSPFEIGFETVKGLVTERYGDFYRDIAVYRKEIKHWPKIKTGDADACQKL